MILYMQRELLLMKKMILTIVVLLGVPLIAHGQLSLTIEKALDIAEENSPTLRRSHMNLDRYQENLVAQRASLKSRFSLDLTPVDYNKNRRFDNRLSQWYTNETFSSSGTFRVDQPILWTDGVVSLINTFGWQDNNSDVEGSTNSNNSTTTFTCNSRNLSSHTTSGRWS